MGDFGIKETTEILVAGNEIGVLATHQLKNGVQVFEDFQAFFDAFTKNEDFKAKMLAGWENHQAALKEVGDLDVGEIVTLGGVQLSYVPKYLAALK